MGSIYLPYQKPPRWNIDRATIALSCARMGLPMPAGSWGWPGGNWPDLSGNQLDISLTGPTLDAGDLSFDGNNDYGSVAIDLSDTRVVTLAFGLDWPSYTNDDDLAFEYTVNFNAANGFLVDPNSGAPVSGKFQLSMKLGASVSAASFTRPSVGYHDYLTVFNGSIIPNTISVWVDGVSQAVTYDVQRSDTESFANDTLYLMSRAGSSLFGQGKLRYIQIWKDVLIPFQVATFFADPYGMFEPIKWPIWSVPPIGGIAPTSIFYGPLAGPLGGPI